ncbi:hypothetical protein [Streptomyces sp. NPDC051704]|uniref:hypothetical protein n=1 Tax=Streptomyces sp. NPDC051704 TaxID=3365671 RepID=UPI0037A91D25
MAPNDVDIVGLQRAPRVRPEDVHLLYRSLQGARQLPFGGFRPELDVPLPDVVDQAFNRFGRA